MARLTQAMVDGLGSGREMPREARGAERTEREMKTRERGPLARL